MILPVQTTFSTSMMASVIMLSQTFSDKPSEMKKVYLHWIYEFTTTKYFGSFCFDFKNINLTSFKHQKRILFISLNDYWFQ